MYEVGDQFILETISHSFTRNYKSRVTLTKVQVVKANKSSIYFVPVKALKQKNAIQYRLQVKTGRIVEPFTDFSTSYRIWDSKEAYKAAMAKAERIQSLRNEVRDLLRSASAEELESAIKAMGGEILVPEVSK